MTCLVSTMVGLFKKLSKKKPRNRKKAQSASEDESCNEDDGLSRPQRHDRFGSPTSVNTESSNGISRVTPDICRNDVGVNSSRSPNSSQRDSHGFEGTDSEFGIEDNIIDTLVDDDLLSINSAEEGSLFDEDILSQFQDGQISLQQFLQSPHLSRSEDRIRDEEMDSFFSDSRSVESSNYYSDSSSGSNHTEQRDEELDRIAGEMFGDYGEKFINADELCAIQKTHSSLGNEDSRSLGNYSIGEKTVTNSLSTLTITADETDDAGFPSAITGSFPDENNFPSLSLESIGYKAVSVESPKPVYLPSDKTDVVSTSASTGVSSPTSSIISHIQPVSSSSAASAVTFQVVDSKDYKNGFLLSSNLGEKAGLLPGEPYEEHPKTLLDLVLQNGKAPKSEPVIDASTSESSTASSPSPLRNLSPFEGANAPSSRPSSAQSQSSQREVAIIGDTVVSSSGRYVLPAGHDTLETKVQTKLDPWLSYLPDWKNESPSKSPVNRSVKINPECIDAGLRRVRMPRNEVHHPGLPVSPSDLAEQERYIRFSSLDLDFFIPPPPVEDDAISAVQTANVDATPFNLEWDYEIAGSPTITPSSSVIYIGNRNSCCIDNDPIEESLLSLLPIEHEQFEKSVSTALGEIITEIVSSRQKILKLTKILEFQDTQIKEQRKLINAQAIKLSQLNCSSVGADAIRIQRSPLLARRNELNSYPATGRRSKELVDLENTLDKLLYQCHTLQKKPNTRGEIQVFQPIEREQALSRAESRMSDDSVVEVKALLCRKITESPANHVQIVPAKGVVYNSCKEMKDDMNAIHK